MSSGGNANEAERDEFIVASLTSDCSLETSQIVVYGTIWQHAARCYDVRYGYVALEKLIVDRRCLNRAQRAVIRPDSSPTPLHMFEEKDVGKALLCGAL